jgi:hypothetical protein
MGGAADRMSGTAPHTRAAGGEIPDSRVRPGGGGGSRKTEIPATGRPMPGPAKEDLSPGRNHRRDKYTE